MIPELPLMEAKLGYQFQDKSLLLQALTHRSFADGEETHYERLEFLGDAVLEVGISFLLLDAHPKAPEGRLSKMRAALVNTQSLAELAKDLELSASIRISRSEIAMGGRTRPALLADVVEALIGAVCKDGGIEKALGLIQKLFSEKIRTVTPSDPKTELQEILHTTGKYPTYVLEHAEGPDHAPTFTSSVLSDDRVLGVGIGTSKKISEQEAAKEALKTLRKEQNP